MATFFLISGPSGVGKDTVVRAILKRFPNLERVVTVTTRPPRPAEQEGVHYYFKSPRQFDEMIRRGEFLEWAWVHGQRYGTLRKPIIEALKAGRSLITDIDVQGGVTLKEVLGEDVVTIFLKYDEARRMEGRIRKTRKWTTEAELRRRIETAQREMAYEPKYDYSIVNPEGHPERVIDEVAAIVEEKMKR